MSLKMINPFDINDSIMTSSISEPDISQGEIEFIERNYTGIDLYDEDSYSLVVNGSVIYVRADMTQVDGSAYMEGRRYLANTGEAWGYVWSTNLTNNEFLAYSGQRTDKVATMGQIIADAPSAGFVAGELVVERQLNTRPFTFDSWAYSITANNPDLFSSIICASYFSSGVLYILGATTKYNSGYAVLSITDALVGTEAEFITDDSDIIPTGMCLFDSKYRVFGSGSDGYKMLTYDTSIMDEAPSSSDVISTPTLDPLFIKGAGVYGGNVYVLSTEYHKALVVDTVGLSITYGYEVGDKVVKSSSHKIYECADNAATNDPESGALAIPPSWVEVSSTNKYKAFDYVINTKSVMETATAELTFTSSQPTTNIALFGLEDVTRVYVEVREDNVSGAVIYDEYLDLAISSPIDDSIVNDTLLGDKVIFDDLPVYATPFITVTFDSDEDEIQIGDVVIGNSRTLGVVTYQSSTSRTSYDTVDTDDFGNETITSRPSAEYTSFEVVVFPEYANYVERILKDSLNKPRVWIGDKPSDEKLFTFGYYERSPITYSSPAQYETTLKVRGLV